MINEKKIAILGVSSIIIISIFSISVLYNITQSASELELQVNELKDELDDLDNTLFNLNAEVSNTESDLNQILEEIDTIDSDLELVGSGSRFEKHNPTFREVVDFLWRDQTSNEEYDENNFSCRHFAAEVNNNAEKEGLICAYVLVDLAGTINHACIAFNTTDQGLIYFEPMLDKKVDISIGEDYWADGVICEPGYYYERDPDSIIEELICYW